MGELLHADFGITHRGRPVTVNRAEVSLAVDKGITQRKVLGHADDGVIGSSIAMRMILTDDVTDDAGRLFIGFVPVVPHLVHGKEAAAVHRFQPVPHIRKRPANDHAHRVIHVGAFHFIFNIDGCFFHDRFKHSLFPCVDYKFYPVIYIVWADIRC